MLRLALAAALLLWPTPPFATAGPPAMAAVGVLSFDRRAKCTGTLIAEDLVLTAGHCVLRQDRQAPVEPGGVVFRTGAYPGHDRQSFPAGDVVVHPLYIGADEGDAASLRYDAGLVRLQSPVPGDVAHPIAVVETEIGGRATFLASYRAGRGERARERRCPIIDEWPEVVSFSCDVRPGESGSPIVVSGPDGLGLAGIVSASSRLKRTEIAFAARAESVVGVLKAMMGGF